jgi:hypothetical protein
LWRERDRDEYFRPEVLEHQLPEAQGAMVLRVSAKLISTRKAAAMLGIPTGTVMTARHRALKLSQLIETPARSAVAHLHGCRALHSSSWNCSMPSIVACDRQNLFGKLLGGIRCFRPLAEGEE